MRVDLTPRGKEWLDCVLQLFQYRGGNGIRSNKSDKDLLEDNELARKEASEPMPRNIQDFKSHPVYALERHLRRNEVIHPRREVGKVSSSTSSTQKSESVFRRKDVHICRTAEQWFRLGQEIKESEQPMKRLLPRSARQQRQRRNPSPLSDDEEEDQEGKPLYLEQQTKVYIPPPIPPAGYPIPRNAYGNLDVYTASMVPERGYHSPHPSTAQAANILGVEAVDAVTGFKFSGRKGKALITGAVIWENHRAALEAVLSGLEDMRREEEEGRWRGVVLGVWRRMLLGLRIRRRVAGYEIEGEREESEEKEREEERLEVARWEGGEEGLYGNDGDDGEEDEGGGFLPDRGGEEAMPTAGRGRGRRMLLDEESEGSDVYVPSDRDGAEGDYRRNQIPAVRVSGKRRRASSTEEDNEAGGFLQDAADAGGGFMPDDDQDHAGVFLAPDEDITVPSADQPQRREELLIATAKKRAEEERPQQQELQPRSENLQLPRSAALAGDPSFKEEETKPKDGKPFAEDEGNGVVPADVLLQRTLKDAELEEATMLQQLYETQSHHPPADAPPFERLPEQDVINNGNGGNGVGDVENVAVAENGSGNVDMVHHVDRDEGEVTQEEEVATQSEKGSLMSEDPDDEDAEPDWLV